ncbi:MAG: ribosome maturation factor RimP [Candidatus Omnitrophota bacterium]
MDRQEIIEQLNSVISEYLDCQDMELVELVYRQEGRDLVLRLLVDYPEGGITIGECAELNRSIGNLLDEKDIIQQNYILEVSSPGLDRPLKTKNDFLRNLDKDVRFFLSVPVNGKLEWCGKVANADDDNVTVTAGGVNLIIPLSKINKAKQEL